MKVNEVYSCILGVLTMKEMIKGFAHRSEKPRWWTAWVHGLVGWVHAGVSPLHKSIVRDLLECFPLTLGMKWVETLQEPVSEEQTLSLSH